MLWILGGDLLRRAAHIVAFYPEHRYGYLGSVAESLLVWAILLYVASRRRGLLQVVLAPIFVLLFTLAAGVEGAFDAIYGVSLSIDGQVHSKAIAWSIVGTLPVSRPIVIFHLALACSVALGLVLACLQPRVKSVLEITRLDNFFRIAETLEEARKA